ncbi:MAG: CZB domain-containing protein [Candidatus Nanopusillus acidilobi]
MDSLDRDALYRLDLFVKHVETIISRLDNLQLYLNTVKDRIHDDGLLDKFVEGLRMHKLYVTNLEKFLSGELDWNPPSYTQCNFGKLYYSIDKNYIEKTYGEAAAFMIKRIGDIHMSFHETAEECLKAQSVYEFKMLIIELASKSTFLVDNVFKLFKIISRDNNNISSRRYL